MPTTNPTTNHLENENNADDISIEGGKADQKSTEYRKVQRT